MAIIPELRPNEGLISLRNTFGIDPRYLLADYNQYYTDMNENAPVKSLDDGLASIDTGLPVYIPSSDGGNNYFEQNKEVSPRTINTQSDLVPLDTSINVGIPDNESGFVDPLGTIRSAPNVFDINKIGFQDPTVMEIANYEELFGGPRPTTDANTFLGKVISDPSKFKGVTSLKDFLPFGKYSITGAVTKGIGSIFDRLNATDFAKATTIADYIDMMKYGGYKEREAAREKTMQEARELQARIDAEQKRKEQEAKNAPAYDYAGRDTDYGTHTATFSKSQAEINRDRARGRQTGGGGGNGGNSGGSGDGNSPDGGGGYCFDPNTPIQMADGSEKKIKDIQLGDSTKGGEVTGVFQFKAADEIHNYKGVTVAGSHYVKEDGKFIMVKDSPIAIKIDKIPVVYSLDTSGRRIFIKDIEFADYNGDGIAKGFLTNAGVDLSGFDKEVLRQVENRLI